LACYYYLITSLPELRMDLEKLPFSRKEFNASVLENITEADAGIFNLLSLRKDNKNVINILENKGEFLPGGINGENELREKVKIRYDLPEYIYGFLSDEKMAEKLPEDRMWEMYFKYCSSKNSFLKSYFSFDRNLRNFITCISLKKLNRGYIDKIVGNDGFIVDSLKSSNMTDFGLGRELFYSGRIVEFVEQKDYLGLEDYCDNLRFDKIDELNRFNYFNIENILGYSIKLDIIERWTSLSDDRGDKRLGELSEKDIGKN